MSPMINSQLICSLFIVYMGIFTNDFSNVGSVTETRLPCSSDGPFASPIVKWDTIFPLESIETIKRTDNHKIVTLNR